MMCWNCRSP